MPRPGPLPSMTGLRQGSVATPAPAAATLSASLQELAATPALSDKRVREHLSLLQSITWQKQENRGGKTQWIDLPADDSGARRMEDMWRCTLGISVTENASTGGLIAISRKSGLDIMQHPFCSQTGERHPVIPEDFMKYRRLPRLPDQVKDLIGSQHLRDLVKILVNYHSNLDVCIFATMVMTELTSPKIQIETHKRELYDAGALPTLCDLLSEHTDIEIVCQNTCAVLRNLLTWKPASENFEKEQRSGLLIQCLNKYPMNNELVHRATGSVLIQASRGPVSRTAMFGQGLVACLIRVLQTPHGRLHMVRRLVITTLQKVVKSVDKDAFREQVDAVKGFSLLNHLRGMSKDDDHQIIEELVALRPDLPRGTLVDPMVMVIDEKGASHFEAVTQIMKSNESRHYEEDPPTPKAARMDFSAETQGSPLFPSQPSFGATDFWDDDDDEVEHAGRRFDAAKMNAQAAKARTPGAKLPQSSLPDVVQADDHYLASQQAASTMATPASHKAMDEMFRKMQTGSSAKSQFSSTLSDQQRNAKACIDLLNKSFSAKGEFPRGNVELYKMLFGLLSGIVSEARKIMITGKLGLVDVEAPCYVFGDIHGNFADLKFYMDELSLFHDVLYTPHPFLFLGDYVDRGKWGPECIAYLLAYKVLAPESFILLRGNHEDNDVCGDVGHYGQGCFKMQMMQTFAGVVSQDDAVRLYTQIVDVFNYMPLSAVIEKKIFASHGGIPRYMGGEDKRYETLRDPGFKPFTGFILPAPEMLSRSRLDDDTVMRQWVYAHDLIWSDPSGSGDRLDEFGFGRSVRGGQVVSYGQPAVDGFLDACGLEFIIRGHEEKADGLNISKQARVLTVFSTSDYCRKGNKAGVALVRKLANGDLLCRMIHRAKPEGIVSPYEFP
eukprot:TRINITY_DN12211_c1_g1_i2.p1 TRINITY_DN12211_c1_g1~~TRINITY_DN12211_c1_g1_i2.p1  ORF type:complete len:919 (+),score=338.59 TRINITY_DN12211_c1_g1_i2:76-2757(+)